MRSLKEKIDAVRHNVFPKSCTRFRDGILNNDTLFVNVFLGANVDEMPHRIFHNDPLNVKFIIESDKNGKYTVDVSASITGLIPDNPHMVYSSRKIRTRRFSGDETKLLSGIQKVLESVHKELCDVVASNTLKAELPYSLAEKLSIVE